MSVNLSLRSFCSNIFHDIPFCPISLHHSLVFSRLIAYILAYILPQDLHADTQRNQDWVRVNCDISPDKNVFSVFVLPGDIGTELDRLSAVFEILSGRYDAVCYCIGNHECWRRGTASGGSSLSPEKRTGEFDSVSLESQFASLSR